MKHKSFLSKLFTEKKYAAFQVVFYLIFLFSFIFSIMFYYLLLDATKNGYVSNYAETWAKWMLGCIAVFVTQFYITWHLYYVDKTYPPGDWNEEDDDEDSTPDIDWDAFKKELAEKRKAEKSRQQSSDSGS